MKNGNIEDLEREAHADPKNTLLSLEFLLARARVYGTTTYLEILKDRSLWNKCSALIQDLVIEEVQKRLGHDFEWLETKLYSCADLSHRTSSFRHKDSGLILNLIPGGTYQMGDNNSLWTEESPRHPVTIGPFLIGRFPVTHSIWDQQLGLYAPEARGSNLPVTTASWNDCQRWLKWLGSGLRMPSESEWEYACRAGSTSSYFWGDVMDDSYCWHQGSVSDTNWPMPVLEHFEAGKWNSFGLVDMSGNVYEWCEDQWENDYKSGPKDSNPRFGISAGRVGRGGCWTSETERCRSAYRGGKLGNDRTGGVGLRVAKTL